MDTTARSRQEAKEVRPGFSSKGWAICRMDSVFVKFCLILERLKRRLAWQSAPSPARTALLNSKRQGKLIPALLRDAVCAS